MSLTLGGTAEGLSCSSPGVRTITRLASQLRLTLNPNPSSDAKRSYNET